MDDETRDTEPGRAETTGPPPILGDTALVGGFFRATYGTENWMEEAGEPPVYRSGPLPAGGGSLGVRRLMDPEAKFHYSVMMAEAAVLPFCVARNAAQRDQLVGEIAQIVGLDTAWERGLIAGYTVCWSRKRFPKTATKIRVRVAEGRRTRSQVLGEMEGHIRRFIDRALSCTYSR